MNFIAEFVRKARVVPISNIIVRSVVNGRLMPVSSRLIA